MSTLPDNRDELVAMAKDLGLSVHHNSSIEKIKEQIEGAQPTVEIAKSARAEKEVFITIHKTEGDSGAEDVTASINGKTWLIQRGREVKVPDHVAEVFRNAVKDVFFHDKATDQIDMKELHSYPFSERAA
jgi:hypothetical protein